MRLRVARKIHIAVLEATMAHPHMLLSRGPLSGHRHHTLLRAWRRIQRVHRRHFPYPVLRPVFHRKRNRPYACEP